MITEQGKLYYIRTRYGQAYQQEECVKDSQKQNEAIWMTTTCHNFHFF